MAPKERYASERFKGVRTRNDGKNWQASIRVNNTFPDAIKSQFTHWIELGTHPNEDQAAHAVDV
jgi:hypothetical protein